MSDGGLQDAPVELGPDVREPFVIQFQDLGGGSGHHDLYSLRAPSRLVRPPQPTVTAE